jgi:hypothetical protein
MDTSPMKNIIKPKNLAIAFLSVAAFAVGCKPTEEQSAAKNQEATTAQIDKVKKETKEAAQEIKDYTYAQRAEFVAKMQDQLSTLNHDLDELSAKVAKASGTAKDEGTIKLKALREQVVALNKQLDAAKNADESTWSTVKAGSRKAYDELKKSFQQVREWLSDKIAP